MKNSVKYPLDALSPKRLAFVMAWVTHGDARHAVTIAGYARAPRSIAAQAAKLVRDAAICAALPIVALALGRSMPADARPPRQVHTFDVAAAVAVMAEVAALRRVRQAAPGRVVAAKRARLARYRKRDARGAWTEGWEAMSLPPDG